MPSLLGGKFKRGVKPSKSTDFISPALPPPSKGGISKSTSHHGLTANPSPLAANPAGAGASSSVSPLGSPAVTPSQSLTHLPISPRNSNAGGVAKAISGTVMAKTKFQKAEVKQFEKNIEASMARADTALNYRRFADEGKSTWRTVVASSYDCQKLIKLATMLLDWVCDKLSQWRVTVKTIEEDFCDGQVLFELHDVLTTTEQYDGESGIVTTLSPQRQLERLEQTLDKINASLGVDNKTAKWTPKLIWCGDLVATLRLLVAIVRKYSPEIQLPVGVSVEVIQVDRQARGMRSYQLHEDITPNKWTEDYFDDIGGKGTEEENTEKAIESFYDTLAKDNPPLAAKVNELLKEFANRELGKVGISIKNITNDMRNGVNFFYLIQLIGGYFIPLPEYCRTPSTETEMMKNNGSLILRMRDLDMITSRFKTTPDELTAGAETPIFRVLWAIFAKVHKEQCCQLLRQRDERLAKARNSNKQEPVYDVGEGRDGSSMPPPPDWADGEAEEVADDEDVEGAYDASTADPGELHDIAASRSAYVAPSEPADVLQSTTAENMRPQNEYRFT